MKKNYRKRKDREYIEKENQAQIFFNKTSIESNNSKSNYIEKEIENSV
jgi:hypothetical protein